MVMSEGNIAKNTLYLTIASVGQKVLAFVYFMFIARVMGVEGTGAYFLALSITTIFSVVADFGLQPVLVREIAKGRDADGMIKSILGAKIGFVLLGALAANATAWVLGYSPLVLGLVALASLVMILDSLHLTFYGILRGKQKLQYESLGVFIGQLLILVTGGAVLMLGPSLYWLIVALMMGSLFNVAYSSSRVVKHIGTNVLVPTWNWTYTKRLLIIALPFFLAGAFTKVYSYIDTVLISQYHGEAAVGLYSIAYKLTYSFQFLPLAFVAALYPGLSSLLVTDKKRVAEVFEDAMWYMMILVTPIVLGIWSIAPELVVAFAGSEFTGSIFPLQVLIFVLFFIFLDFPIGSLLNAADRQGTKTAIMGATMVVNVILNFIFVPTHGVVGACYAALGSFFVLFAGGMCFVPQIIKISFWSLTKRLAPILLSGIIMAVTAYFLSQYLHFILVIGAAAVVYFALLFTLKAVNVGHVRHAAQLIKPEKHETNPPHNA